jgi:hypothetical protein
MTAAAATSTAAMSRAPGIVRAEHVSGQPSAEMAQAVLAGTLDLAVVAGAVPGPSYRVFELADREAIHPVSVVYQPARLSAAGREFLGMLADTAAAAQGLNMSKHDS